MFALIVGVLCIMFFVVVIVKYKNKQQSNSKCGRAPNQTKSDLIDSNQTSTILKNPKKIFDVAHLKLTNSDTNVSPVSSVILHSSTAKISESKPSQAENSRLKRKHGTLKKIRARFKAPEPSNENIRDHVYKELLETIVKNAHQKNHKKTLKITVYFLLIVIAFILGLGPAVGVLFLVIGVINRNIKFACVGGLLLCLSFMLFGPPSFGTPEFEGPKFEPLPEFEGPKFEPLPEFEPPEFEPPEIVPPELPPTLVVQPLEFGSESLEVII